ncbi:hypothetical protein KXD40_003414 [Peronospora effusa]|nr:hypothetical protein KXD40_003414 [Peronospora effusa]
MGDHPDTSGGRNCSSSTAISGVDWSIFKDSEEDAFGWLLRNNASKSGVLNAEVASNTADNLDILSLDDVVMDHMMVSALAPEQQVTTSQAVGACTATVTARGPGGSHTTSTVQSNTRMLAAQRCEGLRASSSRPIANLVSIPSNVNPLSHDNLSMDGSYKELEDDQDEKLWEQKQDIGKQTTCQLTVSRVGKKRAGSTALKERVKTSIRSMKGKTETNATRASKSKRTLKRKKSDQVSSFTADSDPDDDLEKKQLRRVKNLVSVREFRKRKMKQQEQNEARLRRLEAENMDLKMRLKIGKEAILSEQREKQQIKEQMREMLQRNANEQEIAQFLNMYKVTYSDYGPKRREKLHFHLSRIRELLLPTQVTKLSLYSVEQGVDMLQRDHVIKEDPMSAPDSATATMSLWSILADELKVSGNQQRQILERRAAIKNVRDDLNHTLSIVKKLEDVTDEKNTALEAQVAELQEILTPSQATKFIIWVKENPAFMYMLDRLVDSTLQNNSNSSNSAEK